MPTKVRTKKTSTSRKPRVSKAVVAKAAPVMTAVSADTLTSPRKTLNLNPRFLTLFLAVILLALAIYKYGHWFVPAMVGNRPITRFELWQRMEKSMGEQILDDTVNEYALDAAIAKSGIAVAPEKIQDQLQELEKQFESVGGLEEALTQRGLTRAELEKQIRTQLIVEEILADKVTPSDEELQAHFDEYAKTLYPEKTFDEVKDEVVTAVRDTKLRDAFLTWFEQVKQEAQIKNFGL